MLWLSGFTSIWMRRPHPEPEALGTARRAAFFGPEGTGLDSAIPGKFSVTLLMPVH